jgi:hypothetical protein
MQVVRHRINRISELKKLGAGLGAEIDIRSRGGRLILNHEPHANGDSLNAFLDVYAAQRRGRLLILNPKEDGLESEILKQLRRRKIENYFFLDLTIPTTVRLSKQREKRLAIRVSEFEPLEFALRFKNRASWIWLDCFSGQPPAVSLAKRLSRHFRICLVSPELEGYSEARIDQFRRLTAVADAVCTKFPDRWA